MKKIGEYTAKGQVLALTGGSLPHKITLDDGRFDTGYRIVGFEVCTDSPIFDNSEFTAVLKTEPETGANFNWQKNSEIAWAFMEDTLYNKSFVDPDNFVIQDLYIIARAGTESPLNYMIHMEKYETTSARGALAMVRNKSQGAD